MGDLDKTSIVILVCVLTAAVITICLIAIMVYRKKWCRKSEDQPEISGSISLSDIHAYEEDRDSHHANPTRTLVPEAQRVSRGTPMTVSDEIPLGYPIENVANLKDVAADKPVAWTPPPPPPPPDPPNPHS